MLQKREGGGMTKTHKTKMQGKYTYRGCCACLFILLETGMFYPVWRNFVEDNNRTGHLLGAGNQVMAVAIYLILCMIAGHGMRAFKVGIDRKANLIAAQVLTVLIVDVSEILISIAILGDFRLFPKFIHRYFFLGIAQAVVLSIVAAISLNIYRKLFPPLQILEIYGDTEQEKLSQKVNSRADKYHVAKSVPYTLGRKAISAEIQKYDAVLLNDLPNTEKGHALKMCFDMNKRVYFTPKISDIIVKSSEELNLFDTPLFLCRNIGLKWSQLFVKRFFDILLSGIALVMLSPLMMITAVAIKIDDGGPVFYRQERCTIGGKRFLILKFRSMIVDAEKDGKPHPAGEHDDRITRVGRFIRAIRIDELPQLINILIGDMSIVGPRPERWEHVEKYTNDIPEFSYRMKVRGGLTGYAQVYGKYNTEPLDKLKLDLYYITNYSILLDVQIVFETVKILFQKESTEGFAEERVEELQQKVFFH